MTESPPTLGEILGMTSFDLHWIVLLAGAAVLYFIGVRRARTGRPVLRFLGLRSAAFILGLIAMWVAVQSPIEHFGNHFLWANFTSFLLITMVAAPLFVLATPLTLAFRVSGPRWRSRLRTFYRRFPVTWLTFPPVAWLAFAVVTYVWQFSSLTTFAAQHAAVRDVQMLTLLLVGLMFWYPAFAVDPIHWRIAHPLRGLYVLLEMTHKGLFGGMFLSMATPFHDHFANNLPDWGPSAMVDQRLGILILWIFGNLIFIAALVAIVTGWLQYEARNSRRVDRRLAIEREADARRKAALEQIFHKPV